MQESTHRCSFYRNPKPLKNRVKLVLTKPKIALPYTRNWMGDLDLQSEARGKLDF